MESTEYLTRPRLPVPSKNQPTKFKSNQKETTWVSADVVMRLLCLCLASPVRWNFFVQNFGSSGTGATPASQHDVISFKADHINIG